MGEFSVSADTLPAETFYEAKMHGRRRAESQQQPHAVSVPVFDPFQVEGQNLGNYKGLGLGG